MLKTLKITGIIAAALAVVFLVFSAVFGARGNDNIENFLNSPGAVENFKKARGNKQKKSQDQSSPLVKQAQKFALFLNPPVKPKRTASVRKTGTPATPARPKTVSAKFKLIGTSFYPDNPEMSLALIDEPGKGFQWVRQSGKVGHLIIQQIKDGLVVVKDGQRTFEMTPQRKPKKSLIRNPLLPSSTPTDLPPESLRNLPMLPQRRRTPRKTKPPADDEEMDLIEQYMRKLRLTGQQTKSQADWERLAEENAEMAEKMFAELEAMAIDSDEAQRLTSLGKNLENVAQDPNQTENPKVQTPDDTQPPSQE
ncbi:MAG: hypothetical protein ACYS18_03360 [Planctomycetota bacterium]|jgi:hypothetical protein